MEKKNNNELDVIDDKNDETNEDANSKKKTESQKKEIPKTRRRKKAKSHVGKFFLNILDSKVGSLVLLAIVAVVALRFVAVPFYIEFNTEKTTITSETSLTKILKMSKISTYETVYNGIAYVYDKDDKAHKEEPLYLVSYEATVKAGVDFNNIKPKVDKNKKTITFNLPDIEITDTSVDMAKLDIMFKTNSSDKETVSKDAYNAAVNDVNDESKTNQALKELARDNLKNVIKGLIQPLIEAENDEYKIIFNKGGK